MHGTRANEQTFLVPVPSPPEMNSMGSTLSLHYVEAFLELFVFRLIFIPMKHSCECRFCFTYVCSFDRLRWQKPVKFVEMIDIYVLLFHLMVPSFSAFLGYLRY